MSEIVFYSVEELKAYLNTVKEDTAVKITIDIGEGDADGEEAVSGSAEP